MPDDKRIQKIHGTAVAVHGNDIDTDRIIPARFLKCVTFDALGPHAFEDDRLAAKQAGRMHPFDDPRFQGASILLGGANFGCGSSREHAPQSLLRWGIRAIVAESFAEIFFGNCVSLGIPCAVLSAPDLARAMQRVEATPAARWTFDVAAQTLSGPASFPAHLPNPVRKVFLEGTWNPLAELLLHAAERDAVAARLPYVSGW